MKMRVYVMACTYASGGWRYDFVPTRELVTDSGNDYWEDRMDDYVFLSEMDIPEPKVSQLVALGLAKTEEMEKDRIEANAVAISRIKEFESKFLMLEQSEED